MPQAIPALLRLFCGFEEGRWELAVRERESEGQRQAGSLVDPVGGRNCEPTFPNLKKFKDSSLHLRFANASNGGYLRPAPRGGAKRVSWAY